MDIKVIIAFICVTGISCRWFPGSNDAKTNRLDRIEELSNAIAKRLAPTEIYHKRLPYFSDVDGTSRLLREVYDALVKLDNDVERKRSETRGYRRGDPPGLHRSADRKDKDTLTRSSPGLH
ncbi:uncharacterized protein LOC130629175 [Hydractinia symbiolongicarpus]|uniref:uncharacterized protein LOC130629175 n=1 Tax=Hydractinia symbiolongicarpus TaxID=13093 RepID=UPI00254F56A5|nr:uncharacterized protein LOC130629175 [Hydractinia symbiolongicarpus]